mgnify:FL=1
MISLLIHVDVMSFFYTNPVSIKKGTKNKQKLSRNDSKDEKVSEKGRRKSSRIQSNTVTESESENYTSHDGK